VLNLYSSHRSVAENRLCNRHATQIGPCDLDHLTPLGCDKLAWAPAKQGIGRCTPRALAVDLSPRPRDLGLQDFDPLLKLGHTEQLQILSDRLDQTLAATNAYFRRFFHDWLYLSGSPMGRYPTAQAA
jgi:hypothetical protein